MTEGTDAETDPAGAEEAPVGDVRDSESDPIDALEKATAAADENWAKYLRATAELENLRKRATRDVENARKFGIEQFAGELLSVIDSLEMGLEAASNATVESLLEGKQATLKLLRAALAKSSSCVGSPCASPPWSWSPCVWPSFCTPLRWKCTAYRPR